MAKSSRQKQKILYLAKFFLEETDEDHPASMSDILAYLSRAGIEAERKSIYSDLEELSLFGLDIVTLRGRGGGYFLGERDFQLPEVRLLVDAVQSSRFLTRKKSEELIKKLRSLTSRHQSSALSHTVSVSGRIKTMNESIYRNVDAIGGAIIGGTSMNGGVGSVVGTLLGVFVMSLMKTGLPYIGLQANWQQIIMGIVLITAIYIDVLKNKKTQ